MAETLVTVREGTRLTSALNANGQEMKISLPAADLEDQQEETTQVSVVNSLDLCITEDRLRKLKKIIKSTALE